MIGGSGLLGFKVAELAAKEVSAFDVYATYNFRPIKIDGVTFIKLDKTNRSDTLNLVKKVKPDVIIDTAALHNVDYCETHRDEAWKVNVEGTKNVASACKEANAKMIFISTDYIFDGRKDLYKEKDVPNPLSFYAKTKLEGEKAVQGFGMGYVIARPSVIYGLNPSESAGLQSSSGKSVNFALWAIGKLKKKQQINLVTDQYSSPTFADNLAEVLLKISKSNKEGCYHTAGKTCANRYEFGRKIAEIFEFDISLIKPVTSDVFKQVAERPKKCCLDVSKAERDFSAKFLTTEEGLMEMKRQLEGSNNP